MDESADLDNRRYIRAPVRSAVWNRDAGRCAWTDPRTGRRCTERGLLQLDHVHPYGLGGDRRADAVRLLCHTHNQLEARRAYGDAAIDRHRDIP